MPQLFNKMELMELSHRSAAPASHLTQQTHELNVLSISKTHWGNLYIRLQLQVPARCELLSHSDHLNLIIAICDDNTYIVDPLSNNKMDITIKLVGICLMTLLRFSIFETKSVWVCLCFLAAPSAGFIALPYVFNSCYGWRRHLLLAIHIDVSSLPLSFLENKM